MKNTVKLTRVEFEVYAEVVQREMEKKAKDGMFKDMFHESIECYRKNLERIIFEDCKD